MTKNLWLGTCVFLAGTLLASWAHAAAPESLAAGHSQFGHLFNEGPRQEARLMKGMPNVQFPITCKPDGKRKDSGKIVQFFNQGVGQLHGFWSYEAERSFRQVVAFSPSCAIAYWGMAMANASNDARAIGFIKKAMARRSGAQAEEKMWIDALAGFYEVTEAESIAAEAVPVAIAADVKVTPVQLRTFSRPSLERQKDYIKAIEGIVEAYPKDIEAKAFLFLSIWDAEAKFFRFADKSMGDGLPIQSREAMQALADQVLAKNPKHPIHHYVIHLWDGPRARRAVESAFATGPSAPGIAHMWHMAGHTLSKLKRFSDATWHQEAAARLDHAYMMADDIFPDQIHNYAHNNDWLAGDLAITGRGHDALALAKNLVEIPRHPRWNQLEKRASTAADPGAAFANALDKGEITSRFGRKRLFEVLLDFELWNEILGLKNGPYLEPTSIPEEQLKRLHAVALAYVRGARLLEAQAIVTEATKVLVSVEKAQDPAEKNAADTLKRNAGLLIELRLELALVAGKKPDDTDVAKIDQVPRQRRADLLFRLGKRDDALKLAAQSVSDAENELPPLARHAELLWRAGRQSDAENVFARLRPLSEKADLDTPLFARLLSIARAKGLPEDWRPPLTTDGRNAGKGPKPPALETFGPPFWQPPKAPAFSLMGVDGKTTNLADYAGRPVVVMFFLGSGCLHCLEQLTAFAPAAKRFADAGISLLAVSTDSVAGLKETMAMAEPKERLTFPLVSDQTLNTFRAFRAYDGFEKIPLHGTFLIDGAGHIRWHDISYEPFRDVEFLLKESQRLLKSLAPAVQSSVEVGSKVEVAFTALDGRKIDAAALVGKVTLLHFWASWCAPCKQELAALNTMTARLSAEGKASDLVVLGVSFDTRRAELEYALKEHHIGWPQHFDGLGANGLVAKRLGVKQIPALWLLDRKGNLQDLNSSIDLETKVRRLLAGS